jgi:hypothetical protein
MLILFPSRPRASLSARLHPAVPAHAGDDSPDGTGVAPGHDSMRVVARKAGGRVSIGSRNGRPWTTELVAIAAALREIDVDDLVLDARRWHTAWTACPTFTGCSGMGTRRRVSTPSTCLRSTARISCRCRSRTAQERLAAALQGAPEALRYSEHMDGPQGPPCTPTPAAWASKASCRSGGIGPTRQAGALTGSRSSIPITRGGDRAADPVVYARVVQVGLAPISMASSS